MPEVPCLMSGLNLLLKCFLTNYRRKFHEIRHRIGRKWIYVRFLEELKKKWRQKLQDESLYEAA